MKMSTGKHSLKLHLVLLALLIAVVGFVIWLYTGYVGESTPYEVTNYAMGTYVQQTVYGKNGQAGASAAANAISSLENEISWRGDGSEIQKLNEQAGGDPVKVSKDTFSILQASLDVAEETGGAFDPTIYPLSSLWDFGGDNQQVPAREEIDAFLPYVNYQDLALNDADCTARLAKELEAVDLGAAGKGAACDAALQAYRDAGVDNAVIAVGGSIGVMGRRLTQENWRISVRDPDKSVDDSDAGMGVLELSEGFVSTSGVYEKYFEQDGILYHHLLDPSTGYPVENNLLSVSVVAQTGVLSDLLSTACFVLGLDNSLSVLEHYDAQAIFITRDKEVYITEGLKDRFTVSSQAYTLKELQ